MSSYIFQPPSVEEYEVEKILRSAVDPWSGLEIFQVKWLGYDDAHNTWEPKENLDNAQEALKEFRESQLRLSQKKAKHKNKEEEENEDEDEEWQNKEGQKIKRGSSSKKQQKHISKSSHSSKITQEPLSNLKKRFHEFCEDKSDTKEKVQDKHKNCDSFESKSLSSTSDQSIQSTNQRGNLDTLKIGSKQKILDRKDLQGNNDIEAVSQPSKKKQLDESFIPSVQAFKISANSLEVQQESSKKQNKPVTIKRGFRNEKGVFVFELYDPSICSDRPANVEELLQIMQGKDIAEFLLQKILSQQRQKSAMQK